MIQALDNKHGAFMVVEVLGYLAVFLLSGYLGHRCFGAVQADRNARSRQWMFEQVRQHHEQVEEYEARKAAGTRVGPPPQMPLKVAMMFYGSPSL